MDNLALELSEKDIEIPGYEDNDELEERVLLLNCFTPGQPVEDIEGRQGRNSILILEGTNKPIASTMRPRDSSIREGHPTEPDTTIAESQPSPLLRTDRRSNKELRSSHYTKTIFAVVLMIAFIVILFSGFYFLGQCLPEYPLKNRLSIRNSSSMGRLLIFHL